MNKIFSFGTILALVTAPAIAEPSHSSNSFPQSGVMEEDYTYVGQANVTNLKVSSGTATTNATYADCPTGFPNSDDGATSTDQCYTACTVSDFPANSHIATVTGKNYQGANETDTCAIATCDTGYTLASSGPDLSTIIGDAYGTAAYVSNEGVISSQANSYGLTSSDLNKFVVDYGTGKGLITGMAICSTQAGTNNWDGNATTANITADFTNGQNCWCQIDGYKPDGESLQSLSVPGVFLKTMNSCATSTHDCVDACANHLNYAGAAQPRSFRESVFNAIANAAPLFCQANTIQITWADADSADIEANNAGSVTYGGDIRTPRKAVHKAGKVFTGWTFNTPNN